MSHEDGKIIFLTCRSRSQQEHLGEKNPQTHSRVDLDGFNDSLCTYFLEQNMIIGSSAILSASSYVVQDPYVWGQNKKAATKTLLLN